MTTPIYDQMKADERLKALKDPANTEPARDAAEETAVGLPWLRFWRG